MSQARTTELLEQTQGKGLGVVESKYNGTQYIHDVAKYTMLGNPIMQAIEGRKTNKRMQNFYATGVNAGVGTNFETISDQGGTYNYPAGVETVYFTSTSNDDSFTGTGATLIRIEYIDENFDYKDALIPLNGQTGTSIDLYRIMKIFVLQHGTAGSTQGIIYCGNGTITAGVPTNIYATVDNGINATRATVYTVPQGKSMYLQNMYFSTGKGFEAEFEFIFRPQGGDWITVFQTNVYQTNQRIETLPIPFIVELSDIEIRARNTQAGTISCSASFWFAFADDSLALEEV